MTLDIKTSEFSIPLSNEFLTSNTSITDRRGVLIKISNRKVSGFGEATPLSGWTESYTDCLDTIQSIELSTDTISSALAKLSDPQFDAFPALRHGITLALLDLDAKTRRIPLKQSLTQDALSNSVPVNVTIHAMSTEGTLDAVARAIEEGFGTIKLKAGRDDVEQDLNRISRVAREFGGQIDIRVDVNGAWSTEQATKAFEALAQWDISLIEQPLAPSAIEALSSIPTQGIPIAIDEGVVEHDPATIYQVDSVDYAIIKPMALGGIHTAYEAAINFREHGIEPIVTTTIDAVVARTAAVHLAAAIPDISACGLATGRYLSTDLASDPISISNGIAEIPDRPGIGIEEVTMDG